MKAKTILFLVGLVVLYLVIGIDCSQSPGSDRITDLENKVRLLTDRVSDLETSSKLVIWSGYSSEQTAVGAYTPNVIEFSTADDHLASIGMGQIRILKAGYYHINFFLFSRLWQFYNFVHPDGNFAAELMVNDSLAAQAGFNIEIQFDNGVNGPRYYFNEQVGDSVISWSLEGTLSTVLMIDKVLYLREGDTFWFKLPHFTMTVFRFIFEAGYNGLQIRYLGQ